MTIRHFTENNTPKLEVWVGGGQSDDLSGQVTIIDLSEKGVEVRNLRYLYCITWKLALCVLVIRIVWSLYNTQPRRELPRAGYSIKLCQKMQPADIHTEEFPP